MAEKAKAGIEVHYSVQRSTAPAGHTTVRGKSWKAGEIPGSNKLVRRKENWMLIRA